MSTVASGFRSQLHWQGIASPDIELQANSRAPTDDTLSPPLLRNYASLPKSSMYASAFTDASKRRRDASAPLFIPTFTTLRRTIVEHLTTSLQQLERQITTETLDTGLRQQRILEAVNLLRHMDQIIESEVKQSRLEDPAYAATRGLSVLHFDQMDNYQLESQPWVLLTKAWGAQSKNVVEPADDATIAKLLPDYCRDQVKVRAQVDDIQSLHPWTLRPKTTPERQPGTLHYGADGSVRFRYLMNWLWNAVLLLVILALVCFYGVGIIATNTKFSPTFQHYFFWIAIAWSLISSALLSWLSMALGASKRDAVGAFLTGLGIWLVVIQIGQTHLITQAGGLGD
ncbi:hypothetical protein BDV96DRAFT_643854 [Lophiotrema nucula]|uniref:Uncharacterized protein n=1 Tax=Lophiotrema nucula TaxID=690887 RepID=A0A6A5ZHD7_9PLEO|nr:hypothetical protein BDV96DRAFT_643854 [Lophiotrema nucula]